MKISDSNDNFDIEGMYSSKSYMDTNVCWYFRNPEDLSRI